MNFITTLFNSLKSMLLSLITGMSSFLMMMIILGLGEALLLAVSYKLAFGVISIEILFGGSSAAFIVAADHFRDQIVGAIKGLATKLLS